MANVTRGERLNDRPADVPACYRHLWDGGFKTFALWGGRYSGRVEAVKARLDTCPFPQLHVDPFADYRERVGRSVPVVWADQAQLWEAERWTRLIDWRARSRDMLLLVTGNKRYLSDAAWQWTESVKGERGVCVIESDYRDNTRLSDEASAIIQHARINDPERYRHEFIGEFRSAPLAA